MTLRSIARSLLWSVVFDGFRTPAESANRARRDL
jgi:hypothetical protein